jgi:hypothetical protein
MSSQVSFSLSDEAIGQVAKLIQLAMLSGTDLIDHMRMIQFEDDGHTKLVLTSAYKEMFEGQLDSMSARAEVLSAQSTSEVPEAK